jgi:hypothetical protein
VVLLLGAAVLCFGVYAWTGSVQYRRLGVRLVSWTLAAGLVFFGVLFVERVLPHL